MIPIKFPESNIEIAKEQPEYLTLPAYYLKKDSAIITKWVDETGTNPLGIWLTMLTFGKPMSPVVLSTENPFESGVQFRPEKTISIKDYDFENLDQVTSKFMNDFLLETKDLPATIQVARLNTKLTELLKTFKNELNKSD